MLALVVCLLFHGPALGEKEAADQDIEILKRTSKAFSSVARKAVPAVVFIQVEKTVAVGGYGDGMQLNDPFGFFGDEFFERFFGGRGYDSRPREYRQTGQGSGFLISKDGYILTNHHVVGDADKIIVKLSDGRELPAKRIGSDPKSEVAVIKVEGADFPILELGDSSKLEIGEWVIAVGNPFGLTETLTVGVVSAKGRSNLRIAEYEDFIQTDAAINPGNSGGPLLNIEGKVVGINTAIFSQSGGYMGIGFAIPINMAKAIKDQLVKQGKVVRGFLGVHLNREDIDEDMAASFSLKEGGGVLIADVIQSSSAESAGLKEGDIILAIDGKKALDNASFRNSIALIEPGTKVKLSVFRNGQKLEIIATIGTLPDDAVGPVAGSGFEEKLGLRARDLTADIARRFGYDFEDGVIVTDVDPNGPANRAGIQAGHLILSVNRRPVSNVAEFYEALAPSAKGGRILLRVRDAHYSWFVLLRIE